MTKQADRAYQLLILFLLQTGVQFTLDFFAQLVGAIRVGFRDVNLRLRAKSLSILTIILSQLVIH
jgi:hypothetical protein